ncbi:MAG: hypothetical protein JNL49_01250 [Bacteroidia bacterium]|nr:hypothetical protein [Bacteroidia bacterium]
MTIWYTARNLFNKSFEGSNKYIEFSGLKQTEEIVSLDCSLNDPVFLFDSDNQDDWKFGITTENEFFTDCYSSLDYVKTRARDVREYNLLAVCFQPTAPYNEVDLDDFTFIGYDLLDQSHGNSVLTNCVGSPNVFTNIELNKFGLIDIFDSAIQTKEALFAKNPNEFHSNTNVWAIWRHNTIGRK